MDDRVARRRRRSNSKYSPQFGAGFGMVFGGCLALGFALAQLVQRDESPVFTLILAAWFLAFGAWNMRAGRRR